MRRPIYEYDVLVKERLTNGQSLNMWFLREDCTNEENIDFVWNCALFIGDPEIAVEWLLLNTESFITGDGSLEGLRLALKNILSFSSTLGEREELMIVGDDNKRHQAYKWLARYPGFALGKLSNEKSVISYRNPLYWDIK